MNQKGFVLMETIVVISVLCVILVMLYASYSNIYLKLQNKTLYDNTEYIYKTYLVREYLENNISESNYLNDEIFMVCSNNSTMPCYNETENDSLYKFLKVDAVYITSWNIVDINENMSNLMEPTTIRYYQSLDPKQDDDAYRIIVMFKSENDENKYEYASLRFGSRWLWLKTQKEWQ